MAAPTRHRIVVLLCVLALLATTHCGYHFPGEGSLPGGATTIHVAKFENRTRDAGLENYLLEAIQTEVARRGQFSLQPQRSDAQLTLEGAILSIEKRPVAFSSSDEALQYQTYVTVSAVLRDTRNNKAVWRISQLREGESYGATSSTVVTDSPTFLSGSTLNPKDIAQLSDVQLSESQERDALDRVFQNTSRDLYNAMVENF
jgi:outer membrane lipopolysaccharide assembly protein LptE/RlpB